MPRPAGSSHDYRRVAARWAIKRPTAGPAARPASSEGARRRCTHVAASSWCNHGMPPRGVCPARMRPRIYFVDLVMGTRRPRQGVASFRGAVEAKAKHRRQTPIPCLKMSECGRSRKVSPRPMRASTLARAFLAGGPGSRAGGSTRGRGGGGLARGASYARLGKRAVLPLKHNKRGRGPLGLTLTANRTVPALRGAVLACHSARRGGAQSVRGQRATRLLDRSLRSPM